MKKPLQLKNGKYLLEANIKYQFTIVKGQVKFRFKKYRGYQWFKEPDNYITEFEIDLFDIGIFCDKITQEEADRLKSELEFANKMETICDL